jgi:hypothetical protein
MTDTRTTSTDRPYRIERAEEPVPLTGEVDGTPWAGANAASLDTFRWIEASRDPPATVRVLYDDSAVYCQYQVPDDRIEAAATELNGRVWEDSAIEWFLDPHPETPEYCNLEANCVGTFLMSWRRADAVEREIQPETASQVTIETSVSGPTRTPSPEDESWWLAAAIPYDVLETISGTTIAPSSGDRWQGNFHRINSENAADVGVWNPIETPHRDLHSPEFFGELIFA